ncbi:MAG: protein kinase [Candidatus Aminicenantales bacterium]
MKCPKCHTDNPDTSRFCGSCATLLSSDGQPPDSLTKTLQTPAHVLSKDSIIAGKYRIIEEIGRGGMGVVYKTEDIKLKRPVALKFLPHQWVSDPDARERFVQEARAASALDHPNICNIYEIGEAEDGRMYIAMACYEGESLRDKIKRGPLKQEEAVGIAIQAATGMTKAHQKGIVHRDLKPANLLITTDGVVKVVDFGLVKLAGQVKLTREGTTVGTVAYMSPEQAKGETVDQRTDIWSLGIVLYEMLSGVLPFKGDYEQTLIHSILQQEPERLARLRKDLPPGLENIIFKALSKKPSDRYQTMEELLEDLQSVAEGLKPVRAASIIFRGRVMGVKKVYAYPVMTGILILAIVAWLLIFPKRTQAFDSIAVLPIEHVSGDADQEAFCDGVHQELITRLSSIRAFKKVIAKSTMMTFMGTKKKSSEIAKELKVSAIVSVSASRSGDKVRIRFEVIDGLSDKQISGENFDGEFRDILNLESEAAMAIARKIQASLSPEETESLTKKRPVNPDAYDLYLKAMLIVDASYGFRESIEKSLQYFEQAIKIDQDFALGYAGMAWAYDNLCLQISPREAWPKAKVAAEKALSLDDSLVLAHVVLGDMKTFYEWDWEGGEKAYRRALELNPNYAYAYNDFAILLDALGKDDEAVRQAERALELDPNSMMIRENASLVFNSAGQYDKAIFLNKKYQALYPGEFLSSWILMDSYHAQGMDAEAAVEARKLLEISTTQSPDFSLQAICYAILADKSKSLAAIDNMLKQGVGSEDPLLMPMVYAVLGDKDKAFEILGKQFEYRHPNWVGIHNLFKTTILREDARSSVFLRRMGLEK